MVERVTVGVGAGRLTVAVVVERVTTGAGAGRLGAGAGRLTTGDGTVTVRMRGGAGL